VLATVLMLVGAPAAGAAPARPTPAAGSGRVLPIDIRLGPVQVGVTLPLTLNGLLGKTPSSTSAPPSTGAPSTSAPASPSPSAKPYPPTLPTSVPTPMPAGPRAGRSNSGGAESGVAAGSVKGPKSRVRPAPTATSPRPKPSPTPPHSSASRKRPPAMVFVRGVVPDSTPAFLIVLCVACAIGVAVRVRRSGGRRRL
jgi:hypothetical protein